MKFLLPALVLLLLILVGAFSVFSENVIDPDAIAARVAEASAGTKLIFFLGAVVFTAVGLPRQLVAFVCGFVFGLVPGVLVSLCSALLGCIVAFFLARFFLRDFIAHRHQKTVQFLDKLVRHDAFAKVIVVRLQPLGTNLLTNLCAGVSAIRPITFFSATAIGYLPQLLVFALAGDGIRLGQGSKLLLSGAMLLISLVVAYWLWRRHRARDAADIES